MEAELESFTDANAQVTVEAELLFPPPNNAIQGTSPTPLPLHVHVGGICLRVSRDLWVGGIV